ncbi:D-alanyl-D-alanine carboxypeptidase family protein [Amnibacterium sp. CER49]|uniref:D-alanyl-D-alanine carboxypeptidase family protein n=1 Tax=Amnibacterium sp. CER49 TaxID=3039161 RepID=UPI0024493603|nr:D-alanyl-D-alanine carboxypeptidase family protein [Amnibacterium sp. CER49]MDH2444168.1 D-alanyl-D-alanine carboxypeptidase family protein [Amnibacterium sp. CER49]
MSRSIDDPHARCELDTCMADTDEGERLAANAWRHGFLLGHPADREHITGIAVEPWHVRLVGTALAAELHRTGNT